MSMKRKMTITQQLKHAIKQSGLTVYRIGELSGIDKAALSRFLNGKLSLRLLTVDKLADVLGLELKARKRKGR
jgi:transcriptional regulator with XRE-family HTH domain